MNGKDTKMTLSFFFLSIFSFFFFFLNWWNNYCSSWNNGSLCRHSFGPSTRISRFGSIWSDLPSATTNYEKKKNTQIKNEKEGEKRAAVWIRISTLNHLRSNIEGVCITEPQSHIRIAANNSIISHNLHLSPQNRPWKPGNADNLNPNDLRAI